MSRKNEALARIAARWADAGEHLPEYAGSCQPYSDVVVEEAVRQLLLSYGGMGAPFPNRLRTELANAYRRSREKNQTQPELPDAKFQASAAFDDEGAERLYTVREAYERGWVTGRIAAWLEANAGVMADTSDDLPF